MQFPFFVEEKGNLSLLRLIWTGSWFADVIPVVVGFCRGAQHIERIYHSQLSLLLIMKIYACHLDDNDALTDI